MRISRQVGVLKETHSSNDAIDARHISVPNLGRYNKAIEPQSKRKQIAITNYKFLICIAFRAAATTTTFLEYFFAESNNALTVCCYNGFSQTLINTTITHMTIYINTCICSIYPTHRALQICWKSYLPLLTLIITRYFICIMAPTLIHTSSCCDGTRHRQGLLPLLMRPLPARLRRSQHESKQ